VENDVKVVDGRPVFDPRGPLVDGCPDFQSPNGELTSVADVRRMVRLEQATRLRPSFEARLVQRARSRSQRCSVSQRIVDVIIASIALMLLGPVMAAVAVVIKASSRGPVLFRQTRVGLHGHMFTCLKFRTMVANAEARLMSVLVAQPTALHQFRGSYKLVDDPRITRIGHWLRRTSLDELPQLLNVLKGEMSIVGPRPVVPEELWRYGDHSHLLLQTRPGLTGLWQISGRSNLPYDERVRLDTKYALTRSLRGDVRIMLATIPEMLGRNADAY
jgi:exopolysaccharide production protein ExoY